MPPVNYGTHKKTPHDPRRKTGTPSEYTDAQYKALEALKQKTPKLVYGAARAEFANKVLLADGTISDDLDAVRAATQQADADDWTRFRAFAEEHASAIAQRTLPPEMKEQYESLYYWAKHSQADELEGHIAQQRFLFVVDADLVTRIYFQCVTPDNPDIDFANPEEDPDRERRQAAREAITAARAARIGGN